jgi:BMFP domain-containing protein YqiC
MKKPDLKDINLGRLVEDVLAVAQTFRNEGTARLRTELEKLLGKMDFVTRKEFEAVRAIAIAARTQAEKLDEQLNGKRKKKTPAKKAKKAR